jgi:hypothetical protein
LLHDVGADSDERVAWTANVNIASSDPNVAWRVMAATSIDQPRLKAQAGVKNTGRKSDQHVLHFSLSWHQEEQASLTPEEMLRAAKAMLRVMGAEEHQSLVVAHNDRPQPHVHVIVNRVNPKDGRILSSSYERLQASRWAQRYEEERGKVYCVERIVNNAARKRRERVRGKKDTPRHVLEAAKAVNDNRAKEELLKKHRLQARLLKEEERRLAALHDGSYHALEERYGKDRAEALGGGRQALRAGLDAVRGRYRPQHSALLHRHQDELTAFERREAQTLGRLQNALRSIDWRGLLGVRSTREDTKAVTLSGVFQAISDRGARQDVIRTRQAQEVARLLGAQKREEKAIVAEHKQRLAGALALLRERFLRDRDDLLLKRGLETAKLHARWLEKGRAMRAYAESLRQGQAPSPAVERVRFDLPEAPALHTPQAAGERLAEKLREIDQQLQNARQAERRARTR